MDLLEQHDERHGVSILLGSSFGSQLIAFSGQGPVAAAAGGGAPGPPGGGGGDDPYNRDNKVGQGSFGSPVVRLVRLRSAVCFRLSRGLLARARPLCGRLPRGWIGLAWFRVVGSRALGLCVVAFRAVGSPFRAVGSGLRAVGSGLRAVGFRALGLCFG